jgi:hypothetical protein
LESIGVLDFEKGFFLEAVVIETENFLELTFAKKGNSK